MVIRHLAPSINYAALNFSIRVEKILVFLVYFFANLKNILIFATRFLKGNGSSLIILEDKSTSKYRICNKIRAKR